jgi:hypothetical protein
MGHSKLIDGPIGLLWLDHVRFFFACVAVLISIYRVDVAVSTVVELEKNLDGSVKYYNI